MSAMIFKNYNIVFLCLKCITQYDAGKGGKAHDTREGQSGSGTKVEPHILNKAKV